MANVCSFEMRIRGAKENCEKMLDSDIPCYDAHIVKEAGTDEDYMIHVEGECRGSVTNSMVDTDEDNTLAAKAAKFNIELEVFGYDISEPEWIEHFHYKGSKIIKEYNLNPCIPAWNFDEFDLSDEDKAKYDYKEEHEMYILMPEYEEDFEWDEMEEVMHLPYEMTFADLGIEEPAKIDPIADFFAGDKSGLLAMMGIFPDENGFAIKDYGAEGASLFEYLGEEAVVAVPVGVTELETACFSGNKTVEEIILPRGVEHIGEDCFANCPALKKVVIPAGLKGYVKGDGSFEGSPNVTVYAPAGSVGENYAKEHNIPVINE